MPRKEEKKMKPMGYSAYKNTETQVTDNKGKILLMLFEGAVRFTKFARMGMEKKDPRIKGENISKVLAILTELDCALDQERGKELADNLTGLYQYMMRRLTHANLKNEIEPLEEVEKLLNELKEAFDNAVKQTEGSSVDSPEQPIAPPAAATNEKVSLAV